VPAYSPSVGKGLRTERQLTGKRLQTHTHAALSASTTPGSGLWWRLSLWTRLGVILLLITASIIPSSRFGVSVALWTVCTLALLLARAFKPRLLHLFYLGLTAMTCLYALLFAYAFRRPAADAFAFSRHYPEFMFYLLSAVLVTSGVRIQEWVWVCGRVPVLGTAVTTIVLAVSTAMNSLSHALQRATEAARIAAASSWFGDSPRRLSLSERAELAVVISAEMSGILSNSISRWRTRSQPVNAVASEFRPHEIYRVRYFPQVCDRVFGEAEINDEWQRALRAYCKPGQSVLEIGAGGGRLSSLLSSWGCQVQAMEPNPYFATLFKSSYRHVTLIEAMFPTAAVREVHDTIVLHRNVFIELINELSLAAVWAALRDALTSSGVVLLDYPLLAEPLQLGERHVALATEISSVGYVEYSYEVVEVDGESVVAELSWNVDSTVVRHHQRFRLRCYGPSLNCISQSAASVGLTLESETSLSTFTFYPGQMRLCAFRRS